MIPVIVHWGVGLVKVVDRSHSSDCLTSVVSTTDTNSKMSSNDAGIKRLMAAEQAAQAVIQAARQEKATKIKQAQQEAEKDVAVYKAQREDAYKKMMEAGKGDAAGRLATLEKETATSITSLESAVSAKKKDATSAILGWVTKVY